MLHPIVVATLALLLAPPAIAQTRQQRADEYAKRYRALDKKDVSAILALADWCRANDLRGRAKRLYRRVLKLDPANDRANAAVGNVKVGTRWVPPEKADAARAELAAALLAAKQKREAEARERMITVPDEAERRAEVVRQIEANAARATKLRDQFAEAAGVIPDGYAAALTDRVVILAKCSPKNARRYAEIAEYVYRHLSWITSGTVDAKPFAATGGKHVFYLVDRSKLRPTVQFMIQQDEHLGAWSRPWANVDLAEKHKLDFLSFYAPPSLVHLVASTQASAVANTMGRSFVEHFAKPWFAEIDIRSNTEKNFSMMFWLLEGTGIWASLHAIGTNKIYRVTSRYNQDVVKKNRGLLDFIDLVHRVATSDKPGQAGRSFLQLCNARRTDWNDTDLAMSFSLVDYLIRARPRDWRGLFKHLPESDTFRGAFIEQFGTEKERTQLPKILASRSDRGLTELFSGVAARFDAEWRAWVRANFKTLSDAKPDFIENAPFKTKG